jgi:hypothetical protein
MSVTCDRSVGLSIIGIPVSSTKKLDCHDITEMLLKVALNTITLTNPLGDLMGGDKVVDLILTTSITSLTLVHSLIYTKGVSGHLSKSRGFSPENVFI